MTGGTSVSGKNYTGTQTVKTDQNGKYSFENVPVFLEINGQKELCYYRILAEVPDGYGVTRYQQPGAVNSDWITDQFKGCENYLTSPNAGDYFLLAKPASTLQNPPYILTDGIGGKTYDIVHKQGDVSGYDGGLVKDPATSITGKVWEDKNYDGIQNQDTTGQDEPGIQNVTVKLTQFYFDTADSSWKAVADFSKDVSTKADGSYAFHDLPTYVKVENVRYLAGYQLTVTGLPQNSDYGITRYQQGQNPSKDSDLRASNWSLVQDGQYLILADTAKPNSDGRYPYRTVTVTDSFHNGTKYDIMTSQSVSGQDAGLVPYPTASISGSVWVDTNYNGIWNQPSELAYDGEDIDMILTRAYYNGTTWVADTSFNSKNHRVTIGENGEYTFSDLPTYVEVFGKRYLAGYQLALDSIPDGYGATLYRQGDDRTIDSDLDKENLKLVQQGEYIILAGQQQGNANYSNVTVTDTFHDGVVFDLLLASSDTDHDAGLHAYSTNDIYGVVWDDQNYDGIRNQTESGIDGVTVELQRFYYDGTAWQKDTSFATQKTQTINGGEYRFANLATFVTVKGEKYLAGYRVKLTNIPDGYATTRYRQGTDRTLDSDLKYDDLFLIGDNAYLIVAGEVTQNSAASEPVTIPDLDRGSVTYDLQSTRPVCGQDAGLVSYTTGSISGRIWKDTDYDGIQNDTDLLDQDITVELIRYYYKDGKWIKDSYTDSVTVGANTNGSYLFDDLATYVEINGEKYLAGYQLQLSSVPDGYGITRYHQGTDTTLDSDLRHEDLSLVETGEYVILAEKATADANGNYNNTARKVESASGAETYYDLLLPRDEEHRDGGLVAYPDGSITGLIWKDEDYDGIQDPGEPGYEGTEVILTRSYFDPIKGQWLPDETFTPQTQTTGADGTYLFEHLDTEVTVGHTVYLAGYQLKVAKLPDDLAVTKYWKGEDRSKDSNLIAATGSLVKDGEYIPVAEIVTDSHPENGSQITVTDADQQQVTYDILAGRTASGYDGGYSSYENGSLSGVIWEDINFDGIRNEGEKAIANVEVTLQRFIKVNGNWQPDDSFAPITVKTDETGTYFFDALEGFCVINGEKCLYGYRVTANLNTLPEGEEVTKYHIGDDASVDSDLIAETGDLVSQGQYLLVVGKADYDTDKNPENVIDGYDIVRGIHVSGQDGGVVPNKSGSITGVVWNDQSYDGIRDEDEDGISGVPVRLKRYFYEEGKWELDESFEAECVTDQNGVYRFEGLPTTVYRTADDKEKASVEEKVLLSYRVEVESIDKAWAVGKYQQGDDPSRDSDLRAEDLSLMAPEERIILATPVKVSDDNERFHTVMGVTTEEGVSYYDTLFGQDVSGYDAGLSLFENGAVSGTVWLDQDKDGILDDNERKVSGVEIQLMQYVRKDGRWVLTDQAVQTAVSDKDGSYSFTDLPLYVEEVTPDGETQRYLTGYRLNAASIPEDYEITSYMANHGINDNKLLLDQLAFSDEAYELDGCLVLSGKADDTTNTAYVVEGYDLVKPRTVDQMHAGFLEIIHELLFPSTGEHMAISIFVLFFSAAGAMLLILLIYKRRKRE